MRPMPLRRIRRNADPGLRELERAASSGAVDDLIAYARGRRRVGEDVADWELHPVGYVFLEAWGDLEDAIGFRKAKRADMVRYAAMRPPKMTSGRVEAFPVGRERPEKFYATACSYPLLRPGRVFDWAEGEPLPRGEEEEALHRIAVAEWGEKGAVVVRLEFDAQAEHLADGDHGKGRHYDEAGVCQYCRWLDAYRWRVLIQSDDIRNAAGAPGWYSSWRYQPVLIPQEFQRARVMKKKGKRWKNNPDSDIRNLEREAAGGGAQAEGRLLQARVRAGEASHGEAARLRQIRGERVDPWEFDEGANHVGRIFLEACESWHWDGATASSKKPNRVEGRRLCFTRGSRRYKHEDYVGPYIPVTLEFDQHGGPHSEALLLAQELHRINEWAPGVRPEDEFGTLIMPKLFPCQGAPVEKFYVVPSSYPMYRSPAESAYIVRQEGSVNTERVLHLQAVEWFAARGAVRYVLPESAEITRLRETRKPLKGLRTPEQIEEYLHWWDIYRQRVLVQVVNKQGARSFPGGWASDRSGWENEADHNSRILFPWMWNEGPVEWWNKDRVRLMKRVGKRWKNNPRELRIPAPRSLYPAVEFVLPLELKNWRSNPGPGDEGLRGIERTAAGGGLEEEARLLSARVRAGRLKRLQLQNAADLDYEPALMVAGHQRRGALVSQGWWNARGHRFAVTVLLSGFRTVALHAWGFSYTSHEHSDDWWQAVAEDSTELFLAANFHPFYVYDRAKAWLDAGGRVVMTEGTEGYELSQAALAANTAGQIIQGTGRLPDLRTITGQKQLESAQQVCHAASSLLLTMRNDGQLGFHAKQCWLLLNQAFWGVEQLPGRHKSLREITLDFAIPRILK